MKNKQKTPIKKIREYLLTKHRFEDIENMQKHIRANGCPDYVAVDNILYTMEEYDMEGKEISYHNLRTGNTIIVRTEDRYEKGFQDAKIELLENYGVSRNDLSYAD